MRRALLNLLVDLKAKSKVTYGDASPRNVLKAAAADGSASMVLYRLMQGSRDIGAGPLEMLFNKLNSSVCGCVIGRGAEFGPGFVLFHSNGVVINGHVRGGEHVYLEHQVTLGDDGKGHYPVLGDRVFVGAGAKIFGPVHVGDDTRVGANAVVVKDVDSGDTVVGVPAKPVTRR